MVTIQNSNTSANGLMAAQASNYQGDLIVRFLDDDVVVMEEVDTIFISMDDLLRN